MIKYEHKIRIPYVDVDQMKFAYHSHYVEYFDMARTEMMRSLGISNRELEEEDGITLPVIDLSIKYKTPANYDDIITISTTVEEMPRVTMTFRYEVFRGDEHICKGHVTVAFMNKETKKACRPPKKLIEQLKRCGDF